MASIEPEIHLDAEFLNERCDVDLMLYRDRRIGEGERLSLMAQIARLRDLEEGVHWVSDWGYQDSPMDWIDNELDYLDQI